MSTLRSKSQDGKGGGVGTHLHAEVSESDHNIVAHSWGRCTPELLDTQIDIAMIRIKTLIRVHAT